MIVTAINCGACRIFTAPVGAPTDFTGDYHQDIAHRWHEPQTQPVILSSYQFVLWNFFLPLIQRLNDIQTTDGRRLLYNGLVVLQPECWYATHDGQDLTTFMAGNAGGFFKTGWFIDYRNLSNRGLQRNAWSNGTNQFIPGHPYTLLYPGLPMNRWLHTMLESMGVSRNEYLALANLPSGTTMHGYGDHTVAADATLNFINRIGSASQQVTHVAWPQHVINGCSSTMPFIRA